MNTTEKTVADISILFQKPIKPLPENLVWGVQVHNGIKTEKWFVHEFSIEGECFSVYRPFKDGVVPYHLVGCSGSILRDGTSMRISTPAEESRRKFIGNRIRVRYNTDHIRDSRVLPWRILIDSGSGYVETLAASFHIRGKCHSTRETLPNIGEKWHVGCHGILQFNGTHAYIITSGHEQD
jgi:hypothetical protein